MARPKSTSGYEEIRKTRISANQALRKHCKVDYASTPLRRSSRLIGSPISISRKPRISGNQARSASPGIQKTVSQLRALNSSPKSDTTHVRKYCKVDSTSTTLRRSSRHKSISDSEEIRKTPTSENQVQPASPELQDTVSELQALNSSLEYDQEETRKTHISEDQAPLGLQKTVSELQTLSLSPISNYEEIRKTRISENQARLASLGLQKTVSELRALNSSPKSDITHVRKHSKVDLTSTPLRRSSRLTGAGEVSYFEGFDNSGDGKKRQTTRAKGGLLQREISLEALGRRCDSKGRGSVYDPVYGICCHFCRQKKLCGEDDCKRCGDLDMEQPCIGKTECSDCHSTNGILCRACLKVRYGEEMEEVRSNKEWICPHCVERKGMNPYWICNSSFCLKKRKMVPTGIAIFRAREMGYKSVAHLLMDKLQRGDGLGL